MKNIIILLRVHQYVKNLFIFMPAFFSFSSLESHNIFLLLLAFILFSILSSAIYIFNDLIDIDEDRKHPIKKNRPLAKGTVSLKTAKLIMTVMFFSSMSLAFLFNIELFYILSLYTALNIAYSLKLKHVAILDIFIIAIGFILRLFAGSVTSDVTLSMWIIIMTFLLAIFLALAKRRDDVLLSLDGKEVRKNIDGYNLEFINAAMVLMAGVVVVSYILYTVSLEVIQKMGTEYLYLTSIFVLLGILRYMQITFVEQNSSSPTKIVLKDIFLQITILFWLISFVVIVKVW